MFIATSCSFAQKSKPAQKELEGVKIPSLTQKQFADMQAQEKAAQKIIVAKEQAMLDAEKGKDTKVILDSLADDFTELGSDGGVYFKSDVAAAVPTVEVKDYKLSDLRFRLLTPDAAILMYRLEVDATVGGQAIPRLHRVSTVWTRKDGQWFARFHQGTPIPPAAAAPAKQ